jgi:hypothetical protein
MSRKISSVLSVDEKLFHSLSRSNQTRSPGENANYDLWYHVPHDLGLTGRKT